MLAFVFLLAAFTGYEIISRVPALLHTPLMSGTNFIHGIVLVGSLWVFFSAAGLWAETLAWFGIVLASANVVGGFVTTERMLRLFRVKRGEGAPGE
ncbi:NAD(P) transhydrogenase subunit alpha [mine drainage metagenome]|uniref:proton-translocating NAD(P)(+) transhydrogenase n=1 Tax=mine drainage metagenome TaxID=410659 RepID=T0ZUY3_9ZZZZ